ncbi:putative holin-like toxin [Paenibacillus alvei]|uniref:Holin-like toxin n=1 Tax=Paenibacillus alvei TaxID=44250 RepID=A0ABT4H7V6_PAEAL|nr:putative holin-like toxin [Paenibacillus alvei]MCY9541873.1 putative holin-like toxin [Paenibacillus alvei]MCY9737306.1 putative holin-like toxin [Paenibacillus alvei]MCY9757158.1 putative holin-like toxin [Paenibacillus alvei]MCY9764969.1 putative holin-like toxin [Paenibacillus alvei]MCY9771184.1 putative holin-like toxin [Paenibacillus alvei]
MEVKDALQIMIGFGSLIVAIVGLIVSIIALTRNKDK